MSACNRILNFLDTLQEQPVCEGEDEEYEQIKQKVCSDCPSHKDDYCGYVKRQLQRKCNYLSDVMYGYELGRQSKPKVCEGLEEEIDKRWKEWISEDKEQVEGFLPKSEFTFYARHFAQWGAEHRGSSEIPNDLEEAAKAYADDTNPTDSFYEAFKEGALWMREQMMKEAVEGVVVSELGAVSLPRCVYEKYDGQKVKIIIIKED